MFKQPSCDQNKCDGLPVIILRCTSFLPLFEIKAMLNERGMSKEGPGHSNFDMA